MLDFEKLPAWLRRLAMVGVAPEDNDDLRLSKQLLTLITAAIAVFAVAWVGIYLAVGRPWSALIPFIFQVSVVVALFVFARNKRIDFLRLVLLSLMMALPFLLQWSLGGYAQSGAVAMWAISTALLSSMFGAKAWPWLLGFIGLSLASAGADFWLRDRIEPLSDAIVTAFFFLNSVCVALVVFVALMYFTGERKRARDALAAERAKSEALLLNILPAEIAGRLKSGEEEIIADAYEAVTTLFADIVGFTELSTHMDPTEVVTALDEVFAAFDDIAAAYGLEKVKTIGDAYHLVGGAPTPRPDHAAAVADAALEMCRFVNGREFGPGTLEVRVGIDTGPVVAAVVGKTKFAYDMWGDSVNTAARMESHGVPGKIHVTRAVHDELAASHRFERRGEIEIKSRGRMETFFLVGRVDEVGADHESHDATLEIGDRT